MFSLKDWRFSTNSCERVLLYPLSNINDNGDNNEKNSLKKWVGIFKNMGGNIFGGNFLGGNFPGPGNSPWGTLTGGNIPGVSFPLILNPLTVRNILMSSSEWFFTQVGQGYVIKIIALTS